MNKRIIVFFILAILFLGLFNCKQGKQGTEITKKDSPFKDVNIIFFPGGSEDCPFASVVFKGAKEAEQLMGCNVNYLWSDWLTDKMLAQFKDAISKNPDGIAIMGHPGEVAFKPLIEEALNKGILVTSQNTTLPNIENTYKDKGFGYVGQELYASGITIANSAAKRAGLSKGDRAMVWGLLSQETRGLRTKGCIDALENIGIIVDYIEISDAVNSDASVGTPVITSYIASNPDVKLIITDHGPLTAELGTFLKAANKKPGEIFGAGFDLSAATVKAIKEGWVGAVLDQQPYLQGFLPIVQLCLSVKYRFSGLHIDTGAAIIDITNIEFVEPLAVKGIR